MTCGPCDCPYRRLPRLGFDRFASGSTPNFVLNFFAHRANRRFNLNALTFNLQVAVCVQQECSGACHFDMRLPVLAGEVDITRAAEQKHVLAAFGHMRFQHDMVPGVEADHVFCGGSLAFGGEGDLVAGGRAPALGVAGAACGRQRAVADGAEDDGVVVPVGVELDQDALADFRQGQKAGVGMGAGGRTAGKKALCACSLPAAVGGQGVQPG